MKKKKRFWLQTVKQANAGVGVCGGGFLLYLLLSGVGLTGAADLAAVLFGLAAIYVFFSVVDGRGRDKEAFSYNLLWGSGALAILFSACALLAFRQRLGF